MLNNWALILFWRRFIDEILGFWKGTIRQFDNFISLLNCHTMEYGIEFEESPVDKEVKFLDTALSISENNSKIEYRLNKKETDARHYFNTRSYYPTHVFYH